MEHPNTVAPPRTYDLMRSQKRVVCRKVLYRGHYNMGRIGFRSWSSKLRPVFIYFNRNAVSTSHKLTLMLSVTVASPAPLGGLHMPFCWGGGGVPLPVQRAQQQTRCWHVCTAPCWTTLNPPINVSMSAYLLSVQIMQNRGQIVNAIAEISSRIITAVTKMSNYRANGPNYRPPVRFVIVYNFSSNALRSCPGHAYFSVNGTCTSSFTKPVPQWERLFGQLVRNHNVSMHCKISRCIIKIKLSYPY
jgi:hypothetical protein